MIVEQTVSRVLSPSPFLPFVPNVALHDHGMVKFPSVDQNLLTARDRDPRSHVRRISGRTTYSRGATTNRVGGNFPVRIGNLK